MLRKIVTFGGVLLAAFVVMMLTTDQAELSLESEILLPASSAAVWERVSVVEHWSDWWPGIETARVTPALQSGAILDLVLAGDASRQPAIVQTVIAERRLSWVRSGVLGSTTQTSLRMSDEETHSRVVMVITIHGPQAFLARITAKDKLKAYQQAVLEALRLSLPAQDNSATQEPAAAPK